MAVGDDHAGVVARLGGAVGQAELDAPPGEPVGPQGLAAEDLRAELDRVAQAEVVHVGVQVVETCSRDGKSG